MEYLIAGWIVCGIAAYGLIFADLRGLGRSLALRYPEVKVSDEDARYTKRQDIAIAVLIGLLGPLGLSLALIVTGFGARGWRLWE